MKSFHHAKPPVTIIVCSWKEKSKQMTYRYVFLYTYTHRHVHYMGNFWKPYMISISFTHSGKTIYMKFLMFKNSKYLRVVCQGQTLYYKTQFYSSVCYWHPWTLSKYASGQNLQALHKKLHHRNSQIKQMKCLTICTQICSILLILRQKLACQNHKIHVSDILWETHVKPASLIPSVSTGCLLESDTL